ncbi:MAG TPA: hypothetical protein VMT85_10050 [Thermoanaerobaculia bacterium]|nr:hypothetical protein [Thermoanaerobaculia bacterium]
MSVGDVLFRVLVVAACLGLLFAVCLACQRLSERTRGGLAVEHGQRTARRRRDAAVAAALMIASSTVFAAPVFVWPDISVFVSATLIACSLAAPLVVLSSIAGSRPAVVAAGWLASGLILAAALWLLGGSMIASGSTAGGLEQQATLAAVRELGEAFERWRLDQSPESRDETGTIAPITASQGDSAPADAQASSAELTDHGITDHGITDQKITEQSLPEQGVVRVTELPLLPHAELASRLVPRYLRALPATDGWGRPLELRGVLGRAPRLSIRSPGQDGDYDSDVYRRGTYDPSDLEEDVVWVDGIFVRQPR